MVPVHSPLDGSSNLPEDPTRLRLLEAAEEIFAEVGYEAATVREICERAQVKNVGAINYYFQSKERLYREAVMKAFRTCKEGAPFPEWEPGTTPEQKLRDFIKTMAARMLAIPKVASMQLMMREFASPSPICEEAVNQNIRPMADLLYQIFTELLPDVPIEKRWLIGFSVVGQCLFHRQNRAVTLTLIGKEKFDQIINADVIAEHITHFTFAALGLEKPVSDLYRSRS